MFFEFLFVSFSSFRSSLFLFFFSFVVLFRRLYFFCQKEDKKRKDRLRHSRKNTRPEKGNRTPHLDRERERESREIKMVTPLVKTNKIKKKPNGFTRYQSDTAKRVSVRLFFECISTSARCVPLPAYSHGRETWRGLCSLGG